MDVTRDAVGHYGRAQFGQQIFIIGRIVFSEEFNEDFTQVDLFY